MSSDLPDSSDVEAPAANVEHVRVEDEMEQSYIDYAMSVIAGRALPDVRDGLKPVHRRILYAMSELGVTPGSSHRKSSSIVGETMGDYHPHGDSAIYDTLVRMAQEFSMRYPLVDGQGNFGSMDGDPPAAMRYTEARMTSVAEDLLEDIEKDTVEFTSNYDDRLTEPEVLPAKLPTLLLNGSSGIAVGMSTNIPPHNLSEVVEATIHRVDNPDCGVDDLIDTREYDDEGTLVRGSDGPIEGPDFPTGATIVGTEAVRAAYATGRGRIRVRADYEIERNASGRDRLVIGELPFQENKARTVERIAEDVNDREIEGVSDLRDESDRDGVRVVVDLKRGANVDVVENQLLQSHLETTFGVINLALVDGEPRVLTLTETLDHYIDHRREVVRRRSQHDLREAEDRAHILEGRLTALENADDVVGRIRECADRTAAVEELQAAFEFTEPQAEHIVRMQLGSLTSMEASEVKSEYEDIQETIDYLQSVLADEEKLLGVIKDELREIEAEYGDERRTEIVESDGEVTHEDLIAERDCLVVVTEDDYIKRMPVDEFNPQRRGGKGIIGAEPKRSDRVSKVFRANTHDYLLCFTNRGQVYRLKTYEIPEMSRQARGKSAVNLVDLDDGEEITAVVNTDEFDKEECITMATREGYVKRTCATDFQNILSTGIIAASLDEGDELVDVEVTDGTRDLVVATEQGMTIRFNESEVREMGRSARGVRGVDLREGDRVSGIVATEDGDDERALLTISQNGYGKRTPLSEYRAQSRYGKGLVDIKTDGRNGPVTAVRAVSPDDHVVVMSDRGQIMRCPVADVSTVGRNTMGVKIMQVEAGDGVASATIVPGDD